MCHGKDLGTVLSCCKPIESATPGDAPLTLMFRGDKLPTCGPGRLRQASWQLLAYVWLATAAPCAVELRATLLH